MNHSSIILFRKIVCFFFFAGMAKNSISQCSSFVTGTATSFVSQSFSGSNYAWSNPSYASSSDNSRATASSIATILSGKTEYLKVTGWGFGFSQYTSICGIEVQIEKSSANTGFTTSIQDYEIKLMKSGSIVGSNKATSTDWTTSDATYTYGSNSDLWGSTWSYSDINDANFGIVISAQVNGIFGLYPSARIDQVTLKVYYTTILPVNLISFKAEAFGKDVQLNWETAESNDNMSYTIQRSSDGNSWNQIGNIFSETSSSTTRQYQFTDMDPLSIGYYRIKIITASGQEIYSPVQKIAFHKNNLITIAPNPATNKITIATDELTEPAVIKIYNISGNLLLQFKLMTRTRDIDISSLEPGVYYASFENSSIHSQNGLTFIKSQ